MGIIVPSNKVNKVNKNKKQQQQKQIFLMRNVHK